MKKYILFFWFALSIIHAFGQQASITLQTPLSGNENHDVVARDEIRMTNGFSFSPAGDHYFHAYTNEDMVLPVIYAENPISIDERELDYNLPVGTTAGSHSVSLSGAATYQIPILSPPGTAGMQASVSVVYNSQAGNGLAGYGWNISGLSSITRIGHTIYHDGDVKGVDFNDDRFAMDGNRLVVINDDIYGADQSEYYTENFNASRITSHLNATGGGPLYFTVETKDGKTIEYGNTDNSRVETVSTMASYIISWNVNKITDKKGNYIEFVYHKSYDHTQYWIEEIRYTGNELANPVLSPYNSIHFYYSERTDKHTSYIAGSKLQSNVLLDHIKVFAGNSLVRNYKFNYHYDFYSRLIELKEFNGLGQRYNSTVFEYFDDDEQFNTIDLDDQYSTMSYSYGDFTGDGKIDYLMYPEIPLPGANWFLYQNNGPGEFEFLNEGVLSDNIDNIFGGEVNFSLGLQSISYTADGFNYLISRLMGSNSVDFNGDGYEDLLWREIFEIPGQISVYGYIYGTYDPEAQSFILQANDVFYTEIEHEFYFGDFDGDKKTDFFAYEINENQFVWKLSTIGWFEESGTTWDEHGNIGDFNGNGKMDILTITDYGCTIKEYDETIGSLKNIYYSGYPTSYHTIYTADFNGDGSSEIFTWVAGTGWEVNQICWSGPFTHWLVPTIELPVLPSLDDGSKVYVQDINGDGYSDIITLNVSYLYGYVMNLDVYYSNGNEFLHRGRLFRPANLNGFILDDAEIIFGDFTGDGNVEIKISSGSYHQLIFPPKIQTKNSIIHQVADGLNNVTSFDYSPITNESVYKKEAPSIPSNIMKLKNGILVVETEKINPDTDNELNTSYFYQTARVHKTGKGFLGFSAITTSRELLGFNDPTWLEVRSTYQLVDTKSGDFEHFIVAPDSVINRVKRDIEWDAVYEYENISETTYSYDYHNEYEDPDGFVVMPYLITSTQVDQQKNDLTITADYTVDNYGNILTETIDHDGEGTSSTTTDYTGYNSWCDYLPDYVTITRLRIGEQRNTDETDYVYRMEDDLLQTVRSYAHLSNSIDETYTYDDFGNVTSSTISCTGEVPRSEAFVYDPLGRFITSKTNILGHQSFYTFDHRTGNMLNSTDIQNLKTTHRYDAFGRKMQMVFPDGNKSNYTRNWDTDNPDEHILYYTQIESDGAPLQRSYYDRLGRDVIQAYEHLNNDMVFTKTLYDANGRVASASEPYFENSSPSQWTSYHYDEIGRVEQIDFPTHTETTDYDWLTTTATNLATGISKSATTDAYGLTVAVSDPTGTIDYEYFSHGKPRAITAPDGSTFSITYNDYLRQETLDDPDAGTVEYQEYTGFGELERQVHAGRTTETQYDDYGRPDKISYSYDGQSETIDYDYVEQDNGLGQIKTITQSNGISYHYSYDQYGRLKTEQETIEGQTYQTGYAYDTYGNLQTLTYPSGFSVVHDYDQGYLTEMRRDDNNATLYELPEYNVRGQLTDFVYGNGIQTSLGYDNFGFPSANQVDNGIVLKYYSHFDPGSGNLLWRNDFTNNITFLDEYFAYDDNMLKNRLTEWGEQEQNQFSIQYNNNGNIRCKTDISVYSPFAFQYSPTKPHAITEVNDPTNEYLEFVEGQDQAIAYNAFDKTDFIVQGNKRLEFVYGPDQERKIMKYLEWENSTWALKKTKYYILGNTEIEVDNVTNETRTLNFVYGTAILEQTPTEENLYYLHKDYQGTTLAITDETGNVVQRCAYDPWGRRRDPGSWRNYTATEIEQQNFLFARGYTGHEHLDEFGLINMNGRMYDPLLGRMLSPDNYVQAPGNSQNFNRYSYAMNNPLVYTDPDGELVHLVIGAAIGGITNWLSNGAEISWKGAGYFGVGALSGALGAGVANGVGASLAGQSFWKGFAGKATKTATGAFAGATSGGAAGFTTGFTLGFGNKYIEEEGKISIGEALKEGLNTGVQGLYTGAFYGGMQGLASANRKEWLTGSTSRNERYGNEKNYTTRSRLEDLSSEKADKYLTPLRETTEFYELTIHAPKGTFIDNTRGYYLKFSGAKPPVSISPNYQGNFYKVFVFGSPNGGEIGIPVYRPVHVHAFNIGPRIFDYKIFNIESNYSILFMIHNNLH